MVKKDLIFLAAAQATSRKFNPDAPFTTLKERFEKWHKLFSDIYDGLEPGSTEAKAVKSPKAPKAVGFVAKKSK